MAPDNTLPLIEFLMSGSPTNDAHALSHRRLWLADLALLSVAFIWGVNIPVMKAALKLGITPWALNAFRLVISAFVLSGFALWEFRRGTRPAASIAWWRVFVYAMIVSVAYQYFFLMAIFKTTSANVALIMATVPMWTALGARFFLKEILPPLAWTGLFIAFAGTMIVTVQGEDSASSPAKIPASTSMDEKSTSPATSSASVATSVMVSTTIRNTQTNSALASPSTRFSGNLIALAAALAWAGGTVFSRPLLKTISPLQLAACSATIGLPFHITIAFPVLAISIPLLQQVPLQLCILYSGILSTGFALAMWSYGVKHAGAAQATMFQNLSPIIAIAAAWIWQGETVSTLQAVGGALIIGGLIIMRKSRKVV